MLNSAKSLALVAALAALVPGAHAQSPSQRLDVLANRFVDQELAHDPTLAYDAGLPIAVNDRFEDRTPASLAAFALEEQADLTELRGLNPDSLTPSAMPTYANLREKLESDLQMRACRTELWNVNHFDGWQSTFADVAGAQPVATPGERAQALKRWASLPAYVDIEIANLKRGLSAGYSAPKSVVRRVIRQMNQLASAKPEESPYFSPAARSDESQFKAAFAMLIVRNIDPALRRYAAFLSTDYLPKARKGVAISDLPNGPACYRAFLRRETTLQRDPGEVFYAGKKIVEHNTADVLHAGKELFGTSDIPTTLSRAKSAADQHFKSKDELLVFSRRFVSRVRAKTAQLLIDQLPRQNVVVEPERAFEDAAGVSSHLEVQPDTSKPAIYRIQLSDWADETRAEAEIVVVHETLPGHHLQIALARELSAQTRLSKLLSNAAYQEGWARYAEGMSEEAGIYDTPEAKILRRIWPARGMVVDPGLHAFHWTREQAIRYLMSTGRYTRKAADDTVDRIAVMPGQLTAYDTGAQAILTLRAQAQRRLGQDFDLKAFNKAVIEEGVVPLSELRRHITAWLNAKARLSSVHG